MRLAVVILNWNQAPDTIASVHSLEKVPIAPEHIWVVDNASSGDGISRVKQECPGIHLICSTVNRGFAGGNNLALAEILKAGYDSILLFNNDAKIDAAALEHMCKTLQMHPRIGIVGPVLWDATHPERLLAAGGCDIAHHISSHVKEPVLPGDVRDVDYVPGTCVLIDAEVFHVTGLLDEDFFFGGEVASLCKKARDNGYRCVVDGSANVSHTVDRSAQLRHTLHVYYVVRNRFLYVRRFYPRRKFPLFLLWSSYTAYIWLLALMHRDWQRADAIRLGWLDGLQGRYGGQNARVTGGQVA
ncbi:MAG: glycosyltransferase family 2 protein [Chloroflexi bacterium]|nr:glycosyltransferase family 2 protein [Chloroflexota bacterium]